LPGQNIAHLYLYFGQTGPSNLDTGWRKCF
jgi:hypothetical protein